MPTLYVSYRNADRSAAFTALSDALDTRFGAANIVKDASTFAGTNYIAALENAIMSADVVLVVVGLHWLTATNDAGMRKIDQANDAVHYEIARAMALRKPIVVARIDGAAPLTLESLPADIGALSQQPNIVYNTPADLDLLLPSIGLSDNTTDIRTSTPSALGLMIAIIAGIVTILTLCPLGNAFFFSVAFPLYLFAPHLLFLVAWVLGLFVAAQQRRWGWLAALAIPVVLFLLWSLWIFIQVVQSNAPGAGDFLLLPIFGSYEAEGLVGILLIVFGLLVAGKVSFHWRA